MRVGLDPNGLTGLGGYLGYLPEADAPPKSRVGFTVHGSCQGGVTLVVLLTWGEWGIGVRVWGVP